MKYREEDLVYLVYAPNTASTELQEEPPKSVKVDLEAGTWTFRGPHGAPLIPNTITLPIGSSLGNYPIFEGRAIGVYDRTKIEHLRKMLHQVSAMVSEPAIPMD